MVDLESFRSEARAWLEANCPPEMRKPLAQGESLVWCFGHCRSLCRGLALEESLVSKPIPPGSHQDDPQRKGKVSLGYYRIDSTIHLHEHSIVHQVIGEGPLRIERAAVFDSIYYAEL